MLKRINIFYFFLIIIFFPYQIYAESQVENKSIEIITSIFPLAEFAEAVIGTKGEVRLLLPPGAEIHSWRPRPSDIIKLNRADAFFYIGAHLEPWVHDILETIRNPDLLVLDASEELLLLETKGKHKHEDSHSFDPHVWLDFENDQIIIDRIEKILTRLDPDNYDYFRSNASEYKEKLRALDKKFQNTLKECGIKTFIIGGHAAFGYLARRYNLKQVALYGLNPNKKPSPGDLIDIIELAKKHQVEVIYFETGISGELARIIAKEVGAKVSILNPGANLSREQIKNGKTFLELMENNLRNLKNGLICK